VALSHARRSPITLQWLSYCIGEAIDEDTILIDESVTNGGNVDTYIPRDKPGTLYRSGGSSLGWGLGGAMGTKLARPESTVAAVVGDGSFIYGHPTSTLWAADVHNAPFLTVIYNNQVHYAAKQSLIRGYPDGVSVRQNRFIGVELGPARLRPVGAVVPGLRREGRGPIGGARCSGTRSRAGARRQACRFGC